MPVSQLIGCDHAGCGGGGCPGIQLHELVFAVVDIDGLADLPCEIRIGCVYGVRVPGDHILSLNTICIWHCSSLLPLAGDPVQLLVITRGEGPSPSKQHLACDLGVALRWLESGEAESVFRVIRDVEVHVRLVAVDPE